MTIQKPITRAQLSHSLKLCHRIEDAAWREFVALGATEKSSAASIENMAEQVYAKRPLWCEQPAWVRIVGSFVVWSTAHGSLQTFWALRRKKDKHDRAENTSD